MIEGIDKMILFGRIRSYMTACSHKTTTKQNMSPGLSYSTKDF